MGGISCTYINHKLWIKILFILCRLLAMLYVIAIYRTKIYLVPHAFPKMFLKIWIAHIILLYYVKNRFPWWLSGKESAYNREVTEDVGLIPGLARTPRGGHGNPLQYYCLENSMDRGAQWATAHRVAKNQTWLKRLSIHTCKDQS